MRMDLGREVKKVISPKASRVLLFLHLNREGGGHERQIALQTPLVLALTGNGCDTQGSSKGDTLVKALVP